ncbi:MAG TPA: NAD(P)/FAD-dependent oxidoreductase [Opitutaceae bacterium]
MVSTDCDVLVIGGGPGGSCAAAFARLKGLSVRLVERDEFPRFHIGESLLPMGNAVLQESGAWPKVEAAGFVAKYGAEFMLADGCEEGKEIVFADGQVPGLESTFQVERSRFDAILLDHARSLGTDVRTGTTVTGLAPASDHVAATLSQRDGTAAVITARWVVDAGGRDNLFESPGKKAMDPSPFPRRAAVYSHFEGVGRAPGKKGGNIIIVRTEDGWFWLIPISEERTSIGLVTSIDAIRQAANPESVFRATVEGSPRLRALMARSRAVAPYRVTADYCYVRRDLASPRVVLAGDAAGFYDPIFSSGVYLATHSARMAVDAIARAHAGKRSLSGWERRRYTRRLKAHCLVFRRLIEVFYDNDSFSVFMTQKPPLGLDRAITTIVAGHANLSWPLWWRFRVFLAICRLQRHLPLVRRIGRTSRVLRTA